MVCIFKVQERSFFMQSDALVNRLHSELRKQVVTRIIPPGTKLSEPQLSKRWGVSRTPIREVLRKLETEGLVDFFPYRGFVVSSISIEDLDHIYTIKIALEGLAGRIATPIIASEPEKMRIIQNLLREMEFCSKKGDVENYSKKNLQFHVCIWEWCGNPWLTKILFNLSSQLNRFILRALHVPNRIEKSVKEHRKILEAFKMGNARRVEKAVGIHFKNASEDLKSELRRNR